MALTRQAGGSIAAVEFINEPNLAKLGRLPDSYDAAAYARDYRAFVAFARRTLPGVPVLAHSTSGTGGDIEPQALFAASAGLADGVSYHFYGALSPRCADFGNQVWADQALSAEWLDRTKKDQAVYAELRDRFELGKPLWLTETAQAACGGSAWAATFRDSFRFVDQLGALSTLGVRVVAHNTLDAGDYALVDGRTLRPRPNYWMAWWWQRLMDPRALQVPTGAPDALRLYAHCLAGGDGGVALVALVTGTVPQRLRIAGRSERWTLTAGSLDSQVIAVNGARWRGARLDRLPAAMAVADGRTQSLPPRSISFFGWADAANKSCRRPAQ